MNTITLLSIDKAHEVDIEFGNDVDPNSALLNIIKVDPSKPLTFIELLKAIVLTLNKEEVCTVYQNVSIDDYKDRLEKIELFNLVKFIEPQSYSRLDSNQSFAIVKTRTSDLIEAIKTAMGLNLNK